MLYNKKKLSDNFYIPVWDEIQQGLNDKYPIILYGRCGSGKSFLAKRLSKRLNAEYLSVEDTPTMVLEDIIKHCYTTDKKILVIDEISNTDSREIRRLWKENSIGVEDKVFGMRHVLIKKIFNVCVSRGIKLISTHHSYTSHNYGVDKDIPSGIALVKMPLNKIKVEDFIYRLYY